MSKSIWYESLVNSQLHDLINGLKSDPFGPERVISSESIPTKTLISPYYVLTFKPKLMSSFERERHVSDLDAYSCFIDCLNEQITMGDIDIDEYNEERGKWLDSTDTPLFNYRVVLFTTAERIEDLPFTAKDVRDITSALKKHCNFVPAELLFIGKDINPKGYHLPVQNEYSQEECNWISSNTSW